jgi:hypothetical protein
MSVDPRETALDDELVALNVEREKAVAAVEASVDKMFSDPDENGAARSAHIKAHDKAKDAVAATDRKIADVEERKALLAKHKDKERRIQLAKFNEAQIRTSEKVGNEIVAAAEAMAPHLEKVIEGFAFIKKNYPLLYRCPLLPRGQTMGAGIPDVTYAMAVELYRLSLPLYEMDPLAQTEACFPGSKHLPFDAFGSPHNITPMADVLRDHITFLIDFARGKIDSPVPTDVLTAVDEG